MRAITAVPGTPHSAQLLDVPEPALSDGAVLAQTLAIGVCGTDVEIVSGAYGWAAPGRRHLILGHESIARVLEAPASSGLQPGDLIVGIVRRPDPVPCDYCAAGEWDMCRNGGYTERGIKGADGFQAEYVVDREQYLVRVPEALRDIGVLTEPMSVAAKAIDEALLIQGARLRNFERSDNWLAGKRALVAGIGAIGLMAAFALRLRGARRGEHQ